MTRAILFLLGIAVLSACTEYEGRKTNCWSVSTRSSVEATPADLDCSDRIGIGG